MSNDKTFLTDLGISRQQSSDWQKLAEVPTDITCRAWHQKLTFSPPEANFSRLSSPKMANSHQKSHPTVRQKDTGAIFASQMTCYHAKICATPVFDGVAGFSDGTSAGGW